MQEPSGVLLSTEEIPFCGIQTFLLRLWKCVSSWRTSCGHTSAYSDLRGARLVNGTANEGQRAPFPDQEEVQRGSLGDASTRGALWCHTDVKRGCALRSQSVVSLV